MQTYPPDLLVVPELVGLDPFKTLKALVAQKREELGAQGHGTTLKRIGITVRSFAASQKILPSRRRRRRRIRADSVCASRLVKFSARCSDSWSM
jgi:hypothetical protein